jgi:3-oxoacyl-[acyl-carrier protein] reductase
MDLGLSGRKAIVCAASKGLGRAVAFTLAREGVNLVINARDAHALQATSEEIRSEASVNVIGVVGDITTTAVQNEALSPALSPIS